MKNTAAFAAFTTLPRIITEPGYYLTRAGERVLVTQVNPGIRFNCSGVYSNGVAERWHQSGRLYFSRECNNDIVSKA